MKTSFLLSVTLVVIGATMPLLAAEPELAVYVTDANEDVFVALYDQVAVELVACQGVQDARTVLQLPGETLARETTLGDLQANFGFGTHPRIPCQSDTRFDIHWPATSPIWADLTDSGNYYVPATNDTTVFYAVPSRCTGIKTALAIRERLQLPGVLQGLGAPDGLGTPIVLDCGQDTPAVKSPPLSAMEPWSLHKFDTFLTAESTGDTIYVARYQSAVEGASPAYLPIWRTSKGATSDIVLSGGDLASETEAALKDLFGIPATVSVTSLGAEAVAAVRSAVHVDLCLSNCEGYIPRHAVFLNPGIDLGLTEIEVGAVSRRLSRLGDEQLVWEFEGTREAAFTACDQVSDALGLHLSGHGDADWMTAVDMGLRAVPQPGSEFICRNTPARVCLRRLTDGMSLTQDLFSADTDCPGASHLRVELPAAVRMPAPVFLSGTDFHSIELVPSPGVTRSEIMGTPGMLTGGTSSCLLSSTAGLIFADGLPRLEMRRVTLRRADGDASSEVVAVQVQNGALVLDKTTLGGDTEGTQPVGRGVTLCRADLYVADSSIDASSLAIQGVSSRALVSGTALDPTLFGQSRYGLLLSANSSIRLDHVKIAATTPLVLRGGQAVGTRTDLSGGAGPTTGSAGLMLERSASATFTTSTVRGFRCVAGFTDASSKVSFILPGNDLARDNTHLACGPGQFSLIE